MSTAIQYDTITIKVKADSAQVTKDDECTIIAQLSEFFEDKQLYLTDLFTNRMASWVVNTIRADVCPNVYAEWMHSKDNADHHSDVVNDRNSQIHELRTRCQEYQLTISQRDDMLFTMQKTIDELIDERDDLAEGVLVYAKEADEHEAEINALKARMFDLMTSHTARTKLVKEWGGGI